jgi:hypothetical protein
MTGGWAAGTLNPAARNTFRGSRPMAHINSLISTGCEQMSAVAGAIEPFIVAHRIARTIVNDLNAAFGEGFNNIISSKYARGEQSETLAKVAPR